MDSDLLITGGGLNGATLALAAARAGLTSTVIDALPRDTRATPGFDGRSYALALGSVRMLQALGLWDTLGPEAQPMHGIRVSDGRVGDASVFLGLDFQSAEIEEGPMGHMLEDRFLRRATLDAMDADARITPLSEARVTAQETDARGVQVTLQDGRRLSGRLLIGADGRQSGTATRAGIRRTGWTYRQRALVCAIAHDKPHGGIAHQLFLPSGPLAILPLPGKRSSIVWTEADAQARAIDALGDEDYLTVLRPRFGDFLG
ncbi:FAD-dependent monooxygenase, partial [Citreimonas sp.]|uniref:FAD-dependent monooxygenase n=1 Tax=Citreimonas sp. TaxID=3036715 RepID=UPI0035C80C0F